MKAGDYGDAWNWTCASPPKAPRPWCPRLSFPLDSLLPPAPLQRRLLPKHPKQTCSSSSSSSSYTIYRFFLPSTSGSFLSFSSPWSRQTPTNPNSSTSPPLFRFSNPPFLAPKDSFPQLLSSLNFSFRNLSSHCRQTPPNSDKFAKVRTQWEFARNASMAHTRPRSAKKKTPRFHPSPSRRNWTR
jgi:hypothetical protein